MFERFAQNARSAVEDARYEAERRGDARIGSEHLLIALLGDDTVAAASGVDAETARTAADRLDHEALVAVGLGTVEFRPLRPGRGGRRVRHFTAGARSVIAQSLSRATAEKSRTITVRHLMLSVLDRPAPDPAAAVWAALPVDTSAVRERLDAAR
ncbi:Clp protease [Microbacterium mangrovi]|uniref:Clp protease n=1 Tax=Microbacterium mangrovi TaxID=1348253 RepID=A0A0B1ZZW2_9MICO|nr:Clp protease N-terminal domain-containing protein [Microbacterium mangrovi]KHK95107.1 Clp protease [Microbacterium mangrovi]